MKLGVLGTMVAALAMGVACAADSGVAKIEIPNALWIDEAVLSGGQPTEEALRQAAEAGYRTVVNLRGPGEPGALPDEEALVRSLGMDYLTIPIAGPDAFNEENARRLAAAIETQPRPLMLHCASGNRIGTLLAIKSFFVDGLDADAAVERGYALGMRRLPENMPAILQRDE